MAFVVLKRNTVSLVVHFTSSFIPCPFSSVFFIKINVRESFNLLE